jgi:hypothetical protein
MSEEREMKIDESTVTLQGQHRLDSECKYEVTTRSSFRAVMANLAEAPEAAQAATVQQSGDNIRLMLEQLIAEIVALISGQKSSTAVNIRDAVTGEAAKGSPAAPQAASCNPPPPREFSWESVLTETIKEHESSDFSASGTVLTADGKSITFNLELSMCRDFQCERKEVNRGKVSLLDPLVINFDGKAAALGDTRFEFDLDSNGQDETLHSLAAGSAFLAFDRNGDGRINDGSELFGARSGNGFADLASLDSDGNHWLDEADSAFAALKAWSRDAEGRDQLSSLVDKGVGAIYLGASETPFSLKDDDNRLRGQVRSSGVYLREDGRAGSLQQVDLAV